MENEIRINHIDINSQDQKWDNIISSSSQRTFFHTSSWLKIIEKSFKLKSHHMILEHKGEPILIMPIFSSKIALHSPYISDYGGLCILDNYLDDTSILLNAFKCLKTEIEKIGKKERVPAVYVRGFYNNRINDDFLGKSGFKISTSQLTFILSDFYDEVDILNIFHKKTRNAVRKALKEDLHVEYISSESQRIEEYYRLHMMTKMKHGSDPFPKLFFDTLSCVRKENIDIIMAKYNETYIAGLLGFTYNNRIHIFDNCSDPNYLKFNPNNLLYYNIIERAKERRIDVDFGRTSIDDKYLRQFKERWGSKSYTYDTYRKVLPPVSINSLKLGLLSIKKRGVSATFKRALKRR